VSVARSVEKDKKRDAEEPRLAVTANVAREFVPQRDEIPRRVSVSANEFPQSLFLQRFPLIQLWS